MSPSPTTALPSSGPRAVVVGASIAGLLAARALSEAVGEVVLIDRDDLPEGPTHRGGVPQDRHSHGLLTRGREVIEELLPGITAELVAAGALSADVQQRSALYVGPRPMAAGRSGLYGLGVSREALEAAVRRRVTALPGVVVLQRTSVLDLAFSADGSTVTGVVVSPLDHPGTISTLSAHLVVDASGRTSRLPDWLERHGHQPPVEERRRVDVSYATRRFRRRRGALGGLGMVIVPATAGLARAGILIAQEGDLWTMSLAGYHGERPPTELGDFRAYARTLVSPVLADALAEMVPVDEGTTYRFPSNVRRRYERLHDFPDGLLVIGDALCAFDPVFGQGMTVAALEALTLRDCLVEGRAGLARRYFSRAARHVDTPWMVTGSSSPPSPLTSTRPPLSLRLFAWWVREVQQAAVTDPGMATAFLRVTHLVTPPSSLFAPSCGAQVLRHLLHPLTHSFASRLRPRDHQHPDQTGPGSTTQMTGQRS
ncbi:MAG: FAD-dependent monooxygenase [Lapillicoccus sp.]